MKARMRVRVSMPPLLFSDRKRWRECRSFSGLDQAAAAAPKSWKFHKISIDYPWTYPYIALAQSRTCLWVSAGILNGE
jgi:hypothetical protein